MHNKAAVDMSRGTGGRAFLFSLDRLGGGQQETILSSKVVPEDLNVKFRSKCNNGFTNRGCLHCVNLRLQGKRYAIFRSKYLK